jgi:hypothetical protein
MLFARRGMPNDEVCDIMLGAGPVGVTIAIQIITHDAITSITPYQKGALHRKQNKPIPATTKGGKDQ